MMNIECHNEKILLVGGGGFIGHALVVELLKYYPIKNLTVIGRSHKPRNALPLGVRYVMLDASDVQNVSQIIEENTVIFDLSYATNPTTSFEDPRTDIFTNINSSMSLLSQACKPWIKKYVLVSSGGTIYGEALVEKISETHSTNPISPYGISKLMVEKYAYFFHKMKGLPIVIARPSNPYGINQIAVKNQGFIGVILDAIANGNSINIFGKTGTIRDYIHVDDLSAGLSKCMTSGKIGGIYNLGPII